MTALVREARYSDCELVGSLMRRNGLIDCPLSTDRWVALWKQNPALPKDNSIPIGWVLEKEGHIVGYLGNIPMHYHYKGQCLVAVAAHGFVVDVEYRQNSLKLTAAFFSQKNVDLLLSTTANEPAGAVYKICKAEKIPQPDYDRALFWVVGAKGFARSVLCKRGLSSKLVSVGGVFLAFALGLEGMLRQRGSLTNEVEMEVNVLEVSSIGQEFDEFWKSILAERSQSLLADRSLSALRWHFNFCGHASGQAKFVCVRRSGKLVGYAVLAVENSLAIGLKRSRIVDLMVEQDDPELIDSLLSVALKQAREDGSHILEMIGFPKNIRARFLAGRAYKRKLPSWQFWYKTVSPNLHGDLKNEDVWYGSSYDGDAGL